MDDGPSVVEKICNELPVAVWVARAPNGELVYANALFAEIMGTTARDDVAVGQYAEPYAIHTLDGQLYPEDRMPFVRALAQRSTVVVDDIVIHRHDGGRVNIRAIGRPLLGGDGEIVYVAVVFTDITAEMDVRQRAAALAHEQRLALDGMGDFVYRHGVDGDFFYISPTVEALTGYTVEQWKQHYTTYLTDSPANQGAVELTERALATGERQAPYQVEIRHRDGHPLTLEVNEEPTFEAGEVTGIVGVARDVTARVKREREIDRLNRSLKQKTDDLERVIYVASHDLRTPLVGIGGFAAEVADLVEELQTASEERRAELTSELPQFARRIEAAVDRMDHLLRGLLRISQLGEDDVEHHHVDMNALLRRVAEGFDFQLSTGGAELKLETLHDCEGDALQLDQVFSNLVGNALKFFEPEHAGVVTVSSSRVGDRVAYRVSDNGVGIDPVHAPRIFDVFNRLDPQATPGLGLGLAIVRRIVLHHGGSVRVEPTPGGGATFVVELRAVTG